MDKYRNFSELSNVAKEGADFTIVVRDRSSATVVIAPHGGGIEPGTSEITEAIAGNDLSFYIFDGRMDTGNVDLHVTSTNFDEPRCVTLVAASHQAIAIHGEDSQREVVYIGGLHDELANRIKDSLVANGFKVERSRDPALHGRDQRNICNRAATKIGVQLELSKGLRRSFFTDLSRKGRQTQTDHFHRFVSAIRAGILQTAAGSKHGDLG